MSGALALYVALMSRKRGTCQMSCTLDGENDQKRDELEALSEQIAFTPEDTAGYICNSCGFDFRYERGLYPNYCPNCGAKVVSDAD